MALAVKQQYFDMVRDSIAAYSSPLGQLAGVNLGRISVVEMPAEMRPFALMSSAPGIIFVNPDKEVLSVPTAVAYELGRLVLEALNPDFFLKLVIEALPSFLLCNSALSCR